MLRTIGTISTDRGLARIVHDDEERDLRVNYSFGGRDVMDGEFPTWEGAREYTQEMWGCFNAKHDNWCLCLRPVEALVHCVSED